MLSKDNRLKNCDFQGIGIDTKLLNKKGNTEYKKIKQSALAEYKKIKQSAFWNLFRQKKYRSRKWL